jgi:hypothetical protein
MHAEDVAWLSFNAFGNSACSRSILCCPVTTPERNRPANEITHRSARDRIPSYGQAGLRLRVKKKGDGDSILRGENE